MGYVLDAGRGLPEAGPPPASPPSSPAWRPPRRRSSPSPSPRGPASRATRPRTPRAAPGPWRAPGRRQTWRGPPRWARHPPRSRASAPLVRPADLARPTTAAAGVTVPGPAGVPSASSAPTVAIASLGAVWPGTAGPATNCAHALSGSSGERGLGAPGRCGGRRAPARRRTWRRAPPARTRRSRAPPRPPRTRGSRATGAPRVAVLGRHVRLVGGALAPPAPGPGVLGDGLAAAHDPHGAARDADVRSAADERERDRVAHVADADVVVGRRLGPAPAAGLVARRRRRRQARQPLGQALVARRAVVGHLARAGPVDPVAQAVVELAEVAEARLARGGDRPPPGYAGRPLGQALVPRPPDARGGIPQP